MLFRSLAGSETKSFDHSLLKAVRKSIKNQVMVAGGIKIDDNFSKIASFADFCDLSGNLESKKGIKDLANKESNRIKSLYEGLTACKIKVKKKKSFSR